MEKIIKKLIDSALVGVDRYTNDGSTWLIFTESKQWVFELTEGKTLWYNYNFFLNLFKYLSVNVRKNEKHITKWFEDTIINDVKNTKVPWPDMARYEIDNVIQNGVKRTHPLLTRINGLVEDTIENGVKKTKSSTSSNSFMIKDTIENGVMDTFPGEHRPIVVIEDTIQNGVKVTLANSSPLNLKVKDILQNGMKIK